MTISPKPNLQLIYVSNIERSTAFYQTLFNAEPVFSSPRYVAFAAGGEALFAIRAGGTIPDATAPSFSEIGIMLSSNEEVDHLFEQWQKSSHIEIVQEPRTEVFGRTFLKYLTSVGLIGLFIAYLSFIHLASSPNWDTDYKYLYFSAQQFLKHSDIYYPLRFFSPSLNGMTEAVNLNPPLLAVLMAPLGGLSYSISFWLWNILNLIFEMMSVVLIVHQVFRPQKAKYLLSFAALLLLLAYFPTFSNLYAQTGGVVFFLITLGWLSFRQQKMRTAGFLWGIAFSIKLFAGLFLWMLIWRKEWHALKKFLLATMICGLVPVLVLGTDIYLKYYAIFAKVTWYSASWNASLLGFFARLFGYGNEENIPFMAYPQLTPILYMSVVVLLLLTFKWFKRPPLFAAAIPIALQDARALISADLAVAYTIVAMLLISPLAWVYYFLLLFIPGAIVFYWNQHWFKRDWLNILLAIALFFSSVPHLLLRPRQIVSSYDIFWWSNCYCYALIIFAVLIVRMRFLLNENPLKTQSNMNQSWVIALFTAALLPSLLGIVTMIYWLITVN